MAKRKKKLVPVSPEELERDLTPVSSEDLEKELSGQISPEQLATQMQAETDERLEATDTAGAGVRSGVLFGGDDELKSAAVTAWKKATGDERDITEIFAEMQTVNSNLKEEERKKNPMAFFLGEMLGGVAVGGGASIAKSAVEGGVYSYMDTEGSVSDRLKGAAEGAGISALTHGALRSGKKVASKLFGKRPETLRTSALGTSATDYKKTGIKDREQIASNLKEIGFFEKGPKMFDIESEKMIRSSKGRKDYPKFATTLEKISADSDDAISNIKKYADDVEMRLKDTPIDAKELIGMNAEVQKVAAELAETNPSGDWFAEYGKIQKELGQMISNVGGEKSTVGKLLKMKSKLQKEAANAIDQVGKPTPKGTMYKDLSRVIKDIAYDQMGEEGAKLKRLNMISHDLQTQGKSIKDVSAVQMVGEDKGASTAAQSAVYNAALGVQKAGAAVTGGVPGKLARANITESILDADPAMMGRAKRAVIQTPMRAQRRSESGASRAPQSVEDELINTPIPRTTDGILANKDFVIHKIALEAPELLEGVEQLLNSNPEDITDVVIALAKAKPMMFERDKYNRVDGIITNPVDADKARKDIMNNDDLSTLDKAAIMNKLNKTGELDYAN